MNENIEKWDHGRAGYNLGHFIVEYLRRGMNEICQIDAATGQNETCASVLFRSIRLARCFGKLGLAPGDPIMLGGSGHLDVHIPFYAAMMCGIPVAGVEPVLKRNELKDFLKIVKPKIVFCEYAMLQDYKHVAQQLSLDIRIITFGSGEFSFSKLMETYQVFQCDDEFRVSTFDVDETYCWLIGTSGSTAQPKIVALTHSHILQLVNDFKCNEGNNGVRKTAFNVSSMRSISGFYSALLMPINHTKVQTSAPFTMEHVIDIINKYKPADITCSPTLLESILRHERYCDLSCFDILRTIGSKARSELLISLRARARADTIIYQAYGLTETGGCIILGMFSEKPYGCTGTLIPKYKAKLISPETGKEVLEPNVPGELCVRGPMMACYYNDPKETETVYTEDGYFKTGDLFFQDKHGYYYFVERIKMLLKYRDYTVGPLEVEEVILTHPGVADVCVTGVPHEVDHEHVVACVVRRPGHHVTANDIKELVATHLVASKHVHGGVVFLDALPTTESGKVARQQVKKLALTAQRE